MNDILPLFGDLRKSLNIKTIDGKYDNVMNKKKILNNSVWLNIISKSLINLQNVGVHFSLFSICIFILIANVFYLIEKKKLVFKIRSKEILIN